MRILLHIILKCLNCKDLEIEDFRHYFRMLKFLVLKKMDDKLCEMIREIDEVLGNEMY